MHTVDHNENIVEVRGVSFSFGENSVLQNIDLSIHRGDYLAIIGGNGAGKTTLLKIILGLLPPGSGAIKLFGQNLNDFKSWSKIGYVPQKATNFDANFPVTVEEAVLMGRFGKRGLFHSMTQEDRKKSQEALNHVGMWEYRKRLMGDLSGGQQQRVFIARALAGDPEVIFLDEPTVGVAKDVKKEFYALLQKLNQELSLTVVLITHDIESVSHEAMHIACIDKTLTFHGSVDENFRVSHTVTHPHVEYV